MPMSQLAAIEAADSLLGLILKHQPEAFGSNAPLYTATQAVAAAKAVAEFRKELIAQLKLQD